MIKKDQVITLMTERGLPYSREEGRRFLPFITAYYHELQQWGILLIDIEFEELCEPTKDNIFDSALYLWKSVK